MSDVFSGKLVGRGCPWRSVVLLRESPISFKSKEGINDHREDKDVGKFSCGGPQDPEGREERNWKEGAVD